MISDDLLLEGLVKFKEQLFVDGALEVSAGAQLKQPSSPVSFQKIRRNRCLLDGFSSLRGSAVHALWGRKYTRMVLGQGRKYTRMVLARVARVTASSVHAVRGLICTRGQGPRLYTRNGFALCTPLFLQLCILCAPCVQVVRFTTMLFGHV